MNELTVAQELWTTVLGLLVLSALSLVLYWWAAR